MNVVGTVNVFDAALAAGAKLVYASSIAALGHDSLYGSWKRANEDTARAYWAEDRFPSTGIRAALVYGVGRDRGLTASMTLAMQAAARGEPFHIVHGGSSPLNHAGDLARIFVRAARAAAEGAAVYDAGGPVHHVREVVAAIEAAAPGARITFEDAPFAETPPEFDGAALAATLGGVEWRSLEQGVRETVELFRGLAWLGSPSSPAAPAGSGERSASGCARTASPSEARRPARARRDGPEIRRAVRRGAARGARPARRPRQQRGGCRADGAGRGVSTRRVAARARRQPHGDVPVHARVHSADARARLGPHRQRRIDRRSGRKPADVRLLGLEGRGDRADEVGREGTRSDRILVNCVVPAAFDAGLTLSATAVERASFESRIPLGRLGRPDELAELVAWLASDRCSFSTGAAFDLTGGRAV